MVKKKVSEVTELIKRGVTPRYVDNDGILVINQKCIRDNRVDLTFARLTSKEKKIAEEKFLIEGDILINSTGTGTLGRTVQINNINDNITVDTHVTIMRPSKDVNAKFLGYFIRLSESLITSMGKGATNQIELSANDLANIDIYLPEKKVQDKIVKILSSYDELIENNLKRIKLLEESVELIYKEWFVNFRLPESDKCEFFYGIPKGWKKKKVGELILKFKRKSKIRKDVYLESGNIPVIDQSKKFIGGYTNNDDAKETDIPAIIFGDHTRIVKYVDFPFASGADGTQLIHSNSQEISQQYFYCAIKSIDLSNYSYARHFKYLKDEEIYIPSKDIMDKFSGIVDYNFKQITNLRNQNDKLIEARDILIPKLIMGEIEV
ncbi:restriction endonuclease subunit S [Clostridium sp. UBA1056]|uniref:restriction endonuclease subunit S n=1 Tax=unclassified Clostridium TaxID=2614128 RepID=UPI003216698C